MKNFLKIFFITYLFFISLSVSAFETHKNFDVIRPLSNQQIFIADSFQENSVVASNSQNPEIYLHNDDKENYISGNLLKTSSQSKFLREIFAKNYNKTFLSKSHKISPFLKNEICTHAP